MQEMDNLETSRYKNAGEALAQLNTDFNEWCSILTSHSLQTAYAVIAANWAVHGTAHKILENSWSTWSLALVFAFLGFNLVTTRCMIWLHFRQYMHAEEDNERWKAEFKASQNKRSPWPYTKSIEFLGKALRNVKLAIPLLAALFFIISLFLKDFTSVVELIKPE